MSLSPVHRCEIETQANVFKNLRRSALVETVQVGEQVVPLDGSNRLLKALQTYAASISLKYTRCHKQQDVPLQEGALYVSPIGAFEYTNNTLVSHFVWLPCCIKLGDTCAYVMPGNSVTMKGSSKLYMDTLVKAHTPFVDSSELGDLFMKGLPLSGYAVNASTYAVARYSTTHLECIHCEEKFDSIQTWASHYTVRVSTVPLASFVAGQYLDSRPLLVPMFSQARFPMMSEEHSPLCDVEDILASNLCGFRVKGKTFAVATYRKVGEQTLLGCIDPFCKRLFASVQEWAAHARIVPAPMYPFRHGLRLGERIYLSTTLPHPHSKHTAKSLADKTVNISRLKGLRPGEHCRLHAPPLSPFK